MSLPHKVSLTSHTKKISKNAGTVCILGKFQELFLEIVPNPGEKDKTFRDWLHLSTTKNPRIAEGILRNYNPEITCQRVVLLLSRENI